MDVSGFGRRVAYWRERRGLTQRQLAELMGIACRTLEDIEAGARQRDPRLSLVEKAADALAVTIDVLLADRGPARECVDQSEIARIRDAVHTPVAFLAPPDGADPDPDGAVAYGWNAFQAAHYSSLGRLLPNLVAQVHGPHADAAATSMAYQLTSATLIKFGDPVTGMLAAERALSAAAEAGPVVAGSAARRYADALIHLGHGSAAMGTLKLSAEQIGPELDRSGPTGWSVHGMLILKAVMAAAERQDAATVRTLLTQATRIAGRLGTDANHAFSAFGPTNVLLHEVAAMVVLGDGMAAVQAASRIDREALGRLPRERRAQLLMDLAAGHFLVGRPDSSLLVLLAAEALAPQEVHCRASSKKLVGELAAGSRPMPEPRLRALAGRCGLSL